MSVDGENDIRIHIQNTINNLGLMEERHVMKHIFINNKFHLYLEKFSYRR
jgi:hypothetical protein